MEFQSPCWPLRPSEIQSINDFEPSYLSALDEIYHPSWVARKLTRIHLLRTQFERLWPQGHPCKLILVTGTNGKGSHSVALEHFLSQRHQVGSWTGPHVFDYAERIRIAGEAISHREIAEIYWEKLRPIQESHIRQGKNQVLSFAELGILMSLIAFEQHKLDWAVMEVGAGGRYAPLMALPFVACVLTNVGQDHPKTLGVSWWQRCLEKAAVARSGVPFFSGVTGEGAPFVERIVNDQKGKLLTTNEHIVRQFRSWGLEPEYKCQNLALAAQVACHFDPELKIDNETVLSVPEPPARFQWIAPNIVIDVAHNADKMTALAQRIQLECKGRPLHLLIGISRRRSATDVLLPLLKLKPQSVMITSASYAGVDPLCIQAELKQCQVQVDVEQDASKAFLMMKERVPLSAVLVLAGSAYMIDQALNENLYVRETNASYGRRLGDPSQP